MAGAVAPRSPVCPANTEAAFREDPKIRPATGRFHRKEVPTNKPPAHRVRATASRQSSARQLRCKDPKRLVSAAHDPEPGLGWRVSLTLSRTARTRNR